MVIIARVQQPHFQTKLNQQNRLIVTNAEGMDTGQGIVSQSIEIIIPHEILRIQKTSAEHWTNGPVKLLCKPIRSTVGLFTFNTIVPSESSLNTRNYR